MVYPGWKGLRLEVKMGWVVIVTRDDTKRASGIGRIQSISPEHFLTLFLLLGRIRLMLVTDERVCMYADLKIQHE